MYEVRGRGAGTDEAAAQGQGSALYHMNAKVAILSHTSRHRVNRSTLKWRHE